MPGTTTALFPQFMRLPGCVATAAKTTYNDSANAVLLDTAGANGTAYVHIAAVPRGTITLTQVQLYRSPDGGTTMYLIATGVLSAYTMAQTTQAPICALAHIDGSSISDANPLRTASGDRLYVAIGVACAAGVVFVAQALDF